MQSDATGKRNQRQRLGHAGEEMATNALKEKGLTIIARNWRCAAGEIDIVAEETAPDFAQGGEQVPWRVLVEVRTRRGTRFGTALQSITPRKQAKMREVAETYVQQEEWRGPWRIDVIAVQMDGHGRLQQIEHIPHAVSGN